MGRTYNTKITSITNRQTATYSIPAGVQIPTWTFLQNGVLSAAEQRYSQLSQVSYTPSSDTPNFSKWRISNFTPAELALAPYAGSANSDPDQDGRSNLMEYAIGSAPKKSDLTLSPFTVTRHNNDLWIEYWRAINTADITCIIQASTNGTTWTDLGSGQSLGASFIWEQFRLIVPISSLENRRMFRLKVTTVP